MHFLFIKLYINVFTEGNNIEGDGKVSEKKIGLITFSRAHNYGSLLQAYALQKKIQQFPDIKCEIIDFSNNAQIEMYSIFKTKCTIKNIIKNAIALFFYPLMKREYMDFEKFIVTNLQLSSTQYTDETSLKELNNEYDMFVTGSDQVWNIKCLDADDAYFLSFVSEKPKIAYAPSFGAQNICECSEHPEKYEEYLKQFSNISIRENNGKMWLKKLIDKDVPVLIDPTMFYTKEEWYPLMSEPLYDQPYILYYSFHFTQEINKVVKKISKKLGLPVIILSAHACIYNLCAMYGFKLARHAGPQEFIRLINDAEFVLSNSFHGTVFSTIFEKNFWFLYGSIQDENDDRAKTLVQQMGIEDRILNITDIDKCDFNKIPDYKKVANNLQRLRKEAFDYLNEALVIEKSNMN